ncbi:hypothetical protein [Odoribacter lunatus]|uniref:hypothetical protein n=1 Tax=Odoribacter lunatus TaxID=2941335 RepID=UPI0020419037|nr:hypothetical protein [Odoribacter lunatus]
MIRQHARDVSKRQIVIVPPFGRQDELPESCERFVGYRISDRMGDGQVAGCRSRRIVIARRFGLLCRRLRIRLRRFRLGRGTGDRQQAQQRNNHYVRFHFMTFLWNL